MTRSKEHRFSLDGSLVEGHAMPMTALAEVLKDWSQALQAAVPELLRRMDLTEVDASVLADVQPFASAVAPGSVEQPWAYAVPKGVENLLALTAGAALDELADKFERGVAGLEEGRVPDWLTGPIARPLLHSVSFLSKKDTHVKLVGSEAVLRERASETLSDFLEREARGRECELQLFGTITSVSRKDAYLYLDSTRHGSVRLAFQKGLLADVCQAMANESEIEARVQTTLLSGGELLNPKLRSMRALSAPLNYLKLFDSLWGVARGAFDEPQDNQDPQDPGSEPSA